MDPVTARGGRSRGKTRPTIDLARISRVCLDGNHGRCLGRIYLAKPDPKTGRAYTRCLCPTCQHPEAWMT